MIGMIYSQSLRGLFIWHQCKVGNWNQLLLWQNILFHNNRREHILVIVSNAHAHNKLQINFLFFEVCLYGIILVSIDLPEILQIPPHQNFHFYQAHP